jgi:zinc transporter, ZIP family
VTAFLLQTTAVDGASASLGRLALFTLLPCATAILGASVAAFRPPPGRLQSMLQHFAAGVVFAVVSVELLPDVTRIHTLPATTLGFALGVACMLAVKELTKCLEPAGAVELGSAQLSAVASNATKAEASAGRRSTLPLGLLTAVGIDVLIDGLLLGVAFAAGAREGAFLAIALAAELLSLGLAVSSELREAGCGVARSILICTGLTALLALGALGGATALRGIGAHTLAGVLSFGCAALLFLVTEELLTEAHEEPETPLTTAMFFVGFLALFLLQMAAG